MKLGKPSIDIISTVYHNTRDVVVRTAIEKPIDWELRNKVIEMARHNIMSDGFNEDETTELLRKVMVIAIRKSVKWLEGVVPDYKLDLWRGV